MAYAGRIDLCEIEADHLHNIPTLMGENNEHRHVYYIVQERSLYLQRLQELGAKGNLEQASSWYSEAWAVLASVAGVTLAE